MTARALTGAVYAMLVETNGQEAVWDMLDPIETPMERQLAIVALGGEVA